jgi:hypothetical protein
MHEGSRPLAPACTLTLAPLLACTPLPCRRTRLSAEERSEAWRRRRLAAKERAKLPAAVGEPLLGELSATEDQPNQRQLAQLGPPQLQRWQR